MHQTILWFLKYIFNNLTALNKTKVKSAKKSTDFILVSLQLMILNKIRMKRNALFLLIFLSTTVLVKGQNYFQNYLFPYNYALYNPAAAGSEEKHIVAAQGMVFAHEDILSELEVPYQGVLSYEGNFSPINSGIGAMIIMGGNLNQNTKKVGISYNYNIKFAPSTSLRIGLRPTFSRYTVDFSDITASGEKETSTKGDLDLGLHFSTFGFYIGASMTNIFEHKHDMSFSGADNYSDPALSLVAGKRFNLQVIKIEPSIAFIKVNDFSSIWVNSNFVLAKMFMFGGSFRQSLDNSEVYNIGANVGISLFGKVEFIGHVYSREQQRSRPEGYRYLEGMIRVKI